jgi:lysylphosphatidylglycerol synthetase-like protein (DUF2156 family)
MFPRSPLPLEPLQRAKKRTKDASVAAYVSAALTVIISIGAAYSQKSSAPLFLLPDAAFIAGLAYGVQRHSRVCAAVLVVYWVIAKWMLWQEVSPGLLGLFVAVGFWLSFIGGLVGAVNYHRYKKEPIQPSQTTTGSSAPDRV